MSLGKKRLIKGIAVILGVLLLGYLAGWLYYADHFLPGTIVNGSDLSNLGREEANRLMESKVREYTLTIRTRENLTEIITADQAGLVFEPGEVIQKILEEQKKNLWFLSLGKTEKYERAALLRYDPAKLSGTLNAFSFMQQENMEPPTDAHLRETDTGYVIVPETQGNQLKKDLTLRAVSDAVLKGTTEVNLEEAGCYEVPAVTEQDELLVRQLGQLNHLTSAHIVYDFGDRYEIVYKDVIKNWLVKDAEGNYSLDRDQVTAYVYQLGYKYDTFGCTRTFYTYDGRAVTVSGGDYGWAIDHEAEAEALYQEILNGEQIDDKEPVYAYRGLYRGSDDIGDTYVEIDLTAQRMLFYKNGDTYVDTDIVSGCPNVEGNETPTGTYAISAKQSPATLEGEDYSSDVTYWMPFNQNVGIHDATWRTEFGGDLYLSYGSHGRINTPYDQAAIIYQNITVGTPVVVYK